MSYLSAEDAECASSAPVPSAYPNGADEGARKAAISVQRRVQWPRSSSYTIDETIPQSHDGS
jgi:hypothetical protein